MSYGVDFAYLHRRVATFVDKLLEDRKLPISLSNKPTKFELVINTRTAKALGLTVPRSMLNRADQVVE